MLLLCLSYRSKIDWKFYDIERARYARHHKYHFERKKLLITLYIVERRRNTKCFEKRIVGAIVVREDNRHARSSRVIQSRRSCNRVARVTHLRIIVIYLVSHSYDWTAGDWWRWSSLSFVNWHRYVESEFLIDQNTPLDYTVVSDFKNLVPDLPQVFCIEPNMCQNVSKFMRNSKLETHFYA